MMPNLILTTLPDLLLLGIGIYIVVKMVTGRLIPADKTGVVLTEPGLLCEFTGLTPAASPGMPFDVRLSDNTRVTVFVTACQQCMEKIEKGDHVALYTRGGQMTARKIRQGREK